MNGTNPSKRALAAVATCGAIALGAVIPAGASAQLGEVPPRDERCKVPPLLYQAAAIADPDSLEGCNFFEDPNYHENRKANGTYTDKGVFSTIFG